MQGRLASLGSNMNELEGLQKTREGLDSWVQSQENAVAEMLKRPGKLRADAAQLEINHVSDMRQTVIEKQAVLEDVDRRLQAVGTVPDHNLKIALETLDEHVRA